VSPVGPFNKTLCPASPSLQWVLWASVPHLPGQDINTLDHRYYDPLRLLRLRRTRLGVVRSSLSAPDTLYRPSLPLCLPHSIVSVWDSLRGGTFPPTPGFRLTRLDLLIPSSYPRKHLDLQSPQATPMNACPGLRPRWCPRHIAIAHPELLPSAGCKASAFLSRYIRRLSS
jgi:hypothetical protein